MATTHYVTKGNPFLIVREDGTMECKGVTNPKAVYQAALRIMKEKDWTLTGSSYDLRETIYHFTFSDQPPSVVNRIQGPDNEFGLPESDLI